MNKIKAFTMPLVIACTLTVGAYAGETSTGPQVPTTPPPTTEPTPPPNTFTPGTGGTNASTTTSDTSDLDLTQILVDAFLASLGIVLP